MVRLRALHFIARAALRMLPPRRAKTIVDEAARMLPKFRSLDEARRAASVLDREGTCLSRSLTLASRLDDARVVIGVDPGGTVSMLLAHAWVEVAGVPLRASDPRGQELVRL